MAGLYLHIPFCRKVCYYCDFHFTVSLRNKEELLNAVSLEFDQRKDEFEGLTMDTIYLGGGTPSVLSVQELDRLFGLINKYCILSDNPEFTMEANPDDLSKEYITDLKNTIPINRFSVGIQSFIDSDLKLLNRRHDAKTAIQCIDNLKGSGFHNINVDLIYGLPWMKPDKWLYNLDRFSKLQIDHLSAYHLTIEPKTVFGRKFRKGQMKQIEEGASLEQFNMLIEFMEKEDFEHYEISNFARKMKYSKHNLGYWTGKPYIGLGPSAHSYDLKTRRWNVSNNSRYIEALKKGEEYSEREILSTDLKFNDYILVSLRTKWGIDKDYISKVFGEPYVPDLMRLANNFMRNGYLEISGDSITLTHKGKFVADYIASELMCVK